MRRFQLPLGAFVIDRRLGGRVDHNAILTADTDERVQHLLSHGFQELPPEPEAAPEPEPPAEPAAEVAHGEKGHGASLTEHDEEDAAKHKKPAPPAKGKGKGGKSSKAKSAHVEGGEAAGPDDDDNDDDLET